MAHEHIARLKQDNLIMSALLKRAAGEPLKPEEKEVLAEIAKARALERRLREKYTLEGVIEKVLREPASNQTGELSYSASGGEEPLQKARDEALDLDSMRKTTEELKERAGASGVNWKDGTQPDGRVSERAQKARDKKTCKPKVMW
jgi:hypothetical protein